MSKKKESQPGSALLTTAGGTGGGGSRQRRFSSFTPPPDVFEEPQQSGSSTVVNRTASKLSVLAKKRRFSSDEQPHPIPASTSAADLDFVDSLVHGSFAELVLVRRRDNNKVVVAKAFHHGTWRSKYLCQSEMRVFQTVNSPWLISFYGLIEDLEEDFLLLEYLDCGNFYQMMLNSTSLTDNQIRFYSAEMFMAVDSLHQFGFMHRNIQLANFLLHHSGHLRICDFGLSYKFETEESDKKQTASKPAQKLVTSPVYASADKYVVTSAKTPQDECKFKQPTTHTAKVHPKVISECSTYYLAPEVLRLLLPKSYFSILRRKEGYSYLCDYWSLGVAIYHMIFGKLPFVPDNSGCVLDKVIAFKKTLRFPTEDNTFVPLDGVALVKALLRKEYKRLGCKSGFLEIQSHAFFNGVKWDLLGHGKVSISAKESEISKYLGYRNSDMGVKKSLDAISIRSNDEDNSSDEYELETTPAEVLDLSLGVPLERDPSVKLSLISHSSGSSSREAGKQALGKPQDTEQRLTVSSNQPGKLAPDQMNKAMPSTSRQPADQNTLPVSLAAARRNSAMAVNVSSKSSSSGVNIFYKALGWFRSQ